MTALIAVMQAIGYDMVSKAAQPRMLQYTTLLCLHFPS
jgi:hypothetical protein